MGIESTTTFSGLAITWPLNGDTLAAGRDHLNLLKKVLKTQFPGAGGAGFSVPITATEQELNYCQGLTGNVQQRLNAVTAQPVAVGAIISYFGLVANIPSNYSVCNGFNNTPNLVDMFVMSTNSQGQIGLTGGFTDAILPSHSHTVNHTHTGQLNLAGMHNHTFLGDDGNANGTGTNLPTSGPWDGASYTKNDGSFEVHTHTHVLTQDIASGDSSTVGSTLTGTNLPPYVKLIYIQRMT